MVERRGLWWRQESTVSQWKDVRRGVKQLSGYRVTEVDDSGRRVLNRNQTRGPKCDTEGQEREGSNS